MKNKFANYELVRIVCVLETLLNIPTIRFVRKARDLEMCVCHYLNVMRF